MIDSTQYQPILPLSAQEFLLNKITQEDFSCIRFLTDDGPKDIEIINFRKEEGIVSFFALAEKQEFTIREIQVLTVDGEIFAKQMFDNPFTILNNKILISFSFSLAQSTSKIEFCEPPIYLFEYPNSIKDMLEKSRLLYKQLKAYTDVMQKARNQYK